MSTEATGRKGKLKVGIYWAASCGGCDISILEIGPHLLEFIEAADIVFWPCATDFKYQDLAAYPDGSINVFLWNGGIRNSEHEELAHVAREKAETLVAYGACACEGGIPALANLFSLEEIFHTVYVENASTAKSDRQVVEEITETPCGQLGLPRLTPRVLRLEDVVPVDYMIPGCPPQASQVWNVILAILEGKVPARNTAVKVGCDSTSVCDDCPREKRNLRITKICRPHLAIPEPDWCLLEQGFPCSGPATRAGCGALCLKAGLPCRGCYGASGRTEDQGMAILSAMGSLLDAKTEEQAFELMDQVPDPVGSLYRFSLSSSHLRGKLEPGPKSKS